MRRDVTCSTRGRGVCSLMAFHHGSSLNEVLCSKGWLEKLRFRSQVKVYLIVWLEATIDDSSGYDN